MSINQVAADLFEIHVSLCIVLVDSLTLQVHETKTVDRRHILYIGWKCIIAFEHVNDEILLHECNDAYVLRPCFSALLNSANAFVVFFSTP